MVLLALKLYYVMLKKETPAKVKAIIIGALGYLILPTDLLPDWIAGLGFADDLGLLWKAYSSAVEHVDADVEAKAETKFRQWFGDDPKPLTA